MDTTRMRTSGDYDDRFGGHDQQQHDRSITQLGEAVDLIEELVQQACWDNQGRINDMAISTYEEACNYLATQRPGKWKREPWGLSERKANEM